MNQSVCPVPPHCKTIAERKAALETELESEQRISRRQVLLKELWKLDQQRSEPENESVVNNQET